MRELCESDQGAESWREGMECAYRNWPAELAMRWRKVRLRRSRSEAGLRRQERDNVEPLQTVRSQEDRCGSTHMRVSTVRNRKGNWKQG